jgi:hypothetical protein
MNQVEHTILPRFTKPFGVGTKVAGSKSNRRTMGYAMENVLRQLSVSENDEGERFEN